MGILSVDNSMIPLAAADRRDWQNLPGSAMSLAIAATIDTRPGMRQPYRNAGS
jgi:hypothetical protein